MGSTGTVTSVMVPPTSAASLPGRCSRCGQSSATNCRRERGVEPPKPRRCPRRPPTSAPMSVPRFQKHVHAHAACDEPHAAAGAIGLRRTDAGRLVDDHLGEHGPFRQWVHGRTTAPRPVRTGCFARASSRAEPSAARGVPPAPMTPTDANCEAPVNTSSDMAHVFATDSPWRGPDPERDADDPDGQADGDAVAAGAGCPRGRFRRVHSG